MHSPRDQLRRVRQQYSFPAITRNAEYERLPGSTGNVEGAPIISSAVRGPYE
jgi:hypothetical protein